MQSIRVAMAGIGVALFAAACVPLPPPPPPPPPPSDGPTLQTSDYVTGLSRVWDVAFLPDGQPIYTENNTGKFYVGAGLNKHEVGAIDTLDGGVAFANSGEGGLSGLALDPSFATNHFLYACYSTSTPDNRVVRLTLDYPTSTALSDYQVVLSGIPYSSSFHDGCRLGFQPGSSPPALFVTTGDAGSATAPQDANGLAGKVLRINTDGTAYAGNTSGQRWYTRGHRNPQGIAFRPGANDPFSVEHGPDVNDEVNKLINGGNSGWDPNNGSGGYDQSKPMTGPTATMFPTWVSGNVTVAPSGGTFVSGSQWGTWDGALVVACLDGSPNVGQRLLVMTLNAAGSSTTDVVPQLANGVRLRTAVQGPDGNLYVVTDGDSGSGKILKVVPT